VADTTPSTSPCAGRRRGAAIDSEAAPREVAAGLSERELEVLLVLVRGVSNREIAGTLGISPKTVGHHVENVYRKVGVHSRAAATRWAFEHDLVRPIRPRARPIEPGSPASETAAERTNKPV